MAETKTLTDLTAAVKNLADELIVHTEARHYLFSVANRDESALPFLMVVEPLSTERQNTPRAIVDMAELPWDVTELILTELLAVEEKLAIDCWKQLKENADQACELVKQLQIKQAAEKEFPSVIPFKQV